MEVNALETVVTLDIDLTNSIDGFEVDAFQVAPKDTFQSATDRTCVSLVFLCDSNGHALGGTISFSQGRLIQVCVKPEASAVDDGLGMNSIDSLTFTKSSNTQASIESGVASSTNSHLTTHQVVLGNHPVVSGRSLKPFSLMTRRLFWETVPQLSDSMLLAVVWGIIIRALCKMRPDQLQPFQ